MATISGLTPTRIAELISTAVSSAINTLTPGSIGASPSGHTHVIADITDFEGGGGGDAAPVAGSVRFVSGGSTVSRGTDSTEVCVLFLVPGDVAPSNAISGLDIWMRTL